MCTFTHMSITEGMPLVATCTAGSRPRRRLAVAVALVALLAAPSLAACATGSTTDRADDRASATPTTGADADAFPVTIEHAFGETTIEEEPERVATLGWSDQDQVLALGVVPVAASKLTYGGNDGGSSDWFDAEISELGAQAPVRYDDADGAPIADIAAARPDLIMATTSGITKEEYEKLSKIAPVVAYPEAPYVAPWQVGLEMAGKALGRSELATKVTEETEKLIEDAAAKYPQLDGTSMLVTYLDAADLSTIGVTNPNEPRVALWKDFGMVTAPIQDELTESDQFSASVSAERSSELESDVLIAWGASEDDMAIFAKDDLIGQIPAIANGHAFGNGDKTVMLAGSNPSPLSLPYIIENLLPGVAAAADGA